VACQRNCITKAGKRGRLTAEGLPVLECLPNPVGQSLCSKTCSRAMAFRYRRKAIQNASFCILEMSGSVRYLSLGDLFAVRMTRRFEIGTFVRLCGGIAEHYPTLLGKVIGVCEHDSGLTHLNKYCVQFSLGDPEWFYEFQLAAAFNGETNCA
jgi:hypothetical protein